MNSSPGSGEVWPGISCSSLEVLTATLARGHLVAKMQAFLAALEVPVDGARHVVSDFNDWIRFEVPAYRSRPHVDDLDDLDLTTKNDLRADLFRYVSSRFTGPSSYLKQSSGSTGPPARFLYSPLFHHETILLTVPKIAARLGVSPNPRATIYCLTIRDKPAVRPTLRLDPTGLGGPGVRVGVDTVTPGALQEVFEIAAAAGVSCISSTPPVLSAIADAVPPGLARRLGCTLVVSGGSALDHETRTRSAQLFGAPVVCAYGLSECGVVASECVQGRLHFNTSDCHVDVIPTEAAASGPTPLPTRNDRATEGEIVISSTRNRAMPLIRYRTGDVGRVSNRPCGCGEVSPVLDALQGRVVPSFRSPSGKSFSPTQFRDLFSVFPWIKEFQMIQHDVDRISVAISIDPRPAAGTGHSSPSPPEVRRHLQSRLEPGVRVNVELTEFGAGTKFVRYISLME